MPCFDPIAAHCARCEVELARCLEVQRTSDIFVYAPEGFLLLVKEREFGCEDMVSKGKMIYERC